MLRISNLFRNMSLTPAGGTFPTIRPTVLSSIQPVRTISVTVPTERGNMTKRWTERRQKHHRITRKRMRNAIAIAESKNSRYIASIQRKQAHVNTYVCAHFDQIKLFF